MSCLTGIFCKLGSVQLSRPVAVTVCWKCACIFPFSSMSGSIPSTYVPFSLVSILYSSISGTAGCASAIFSSISALVEYPVLVFLPLGSPSFSNSMTPSCLGEFILNSSPASTYISDVSFSMRSLRLSPIALSTSLSTLTPQLSIEARTSTSGSSASVRTLTRP